MDLQAAKPVCNRSRSPCSRSPFSDFHIFFKKVAEGAGHGRTRCYNPARSRGNAPAVLKKDRQAFKTSRDARIAQLVEQRIENPRVGGSNPPPGTIFIQQVQCDVVQVPGGRSGLKCAWVSFWVSGVCAGSNAPNVAACLSDTSSKSIYLSLGQTVGKHAWEVPNLRFR